jgi:hypothetical protein
MIGHRFEVELNGREYTAWEDHDGMIGCIEVVVEDWAEYRMREIWRRGRPLGPIALHVIRAMGIGHLVPSR